MNTKRVGLWSLSSAVAICMAALAAAGLMAGCDEADGTRPLTVTPGFVDLSQSTTNQTLTFTVTDGLRELSLPLEWSVSNPELGSIGASGGTTASYRSTGKKGDNTVFVRDQYDAEGVATVRR
jgi:hypothetical protein